MDGLSWLWMHELVLSDVSSFLGSNLYGLKS